MPLLENDVIFAFLNDYDPNRTVSEEVFRKMQSGELTVELSSVSLVEMGLIYRGEGFEDELLEDLAAIAILPNVEYVALKPDVAVASYI
ncbi:hypothetical protein KEJ35_06375 [Candidatus Bathyarchaeota archaeon]|nr:hypothetical protein [Candidatus Bathyarchaeota archaeon]